MIISFQLTDGRSVIIKQKKGYLIEFDIEDVVSIDHGNLIGEYLISPALFSQMALLRAESQSAFQAKKLEVKVKEAEIRKAIKDNWSQEKLGKQTIESVGDELQLSPQYQEIMRELNEAEKVYNQLDGIYWAVKDKSSKLDRLYSSISEEELTISSIERQIGNIQSKFTKL